MQSASSATIKISVPSGIHRNAQREAQKIGISLQDFIRMLMAMYFARSAPTDMFSRDQALWERAREEIKNGQYISVKNKQELRAYLDALNT